MTDTPATIVDWAKKLEPWRSIGLRFCEELRGEHLSPPKQTASDRIRNLRRGRGWTQQRLADAAGIAATQVCFAEHGLFITPDRQAAIANAFNVSVTDIWPERDATA